MIRCPETLLMSGANLVPELNLLYGMRVERA